MFLKSLEYNHLRRISREERYMRNRNFLLLIFEQYLYQPRLVQHLYNQVFLMLHSILYQSVLKLQLLKISLQIILLFWHLFYFLYNVLHISFSLLLFPPKNLISGSNSILYLSFTLEYIVFINSRTSKEFPLL